jgi:hypothetical protein
MHDMNLTAVVSASVFVTFLHLTYDTLSESMANFSSTMESFLIEQVYASDGDEYSF